MDFNFDGPDTDIAVMVAMDDVEGEAACAALRLRVGLEDFGGDVRWRELDPDEWVDTLGDIVDTDIVEGDVKCAIRRTRDGEDEIWR